MTLYSFTRGVWMPFLFLLAALLLPSTARSASPGLADIGARKILETAVGTIAPRGYAYAVDIRKPTISGNKWIRASLHRDSNDASNKARYYQSQGYQTRIVLVKT